MALNIKKDFNNNRSRKPDLTTLVYGKIPPQAPEFEEAILGCCLHENGRHTFEIVLGIIQQPDIFYVDAHQKIFAALLRMYEAHLPIDLLLTTEELRKSNELELVGGGYYLTNLMRKVITDENVEFHCRVIVEKFIQRELIRISGNCIGDAYEDNTDPFDLGEKISDELFKVLSGNIKKEPKNISLSVKELSEKLEELKKSKSDLTGVPSGFSELDAITGGWQKSDLTILAARPSVGKTAFAIALSLNAALAGKPSVIFELEMNTGQVIIRMVSSVGEVEMHQLSHPKNMTDDEWSRYYAAADKVGKLKIFIDDEGGLNIFELRAKARRLKQKHDIELIIIDYLQIMSGIGGEGNREQEISKISRDLKKLAKDLDVPIIALSQLNRSMENTNGESTRDPKLSDLRESGAIEQDADNVIFIHDPSAKMIAANNMFMGKKIINIAKGRNIGVHVIPLEFNKDIQRWRDVDQPSNQFPTEKPPDNPKAGIKGDYNNFNRKDWE